MQKIRIRQEGLAALAFTHQPDVLRQVVLCLPGLPFVPGLQTFGKLAFELGCDVVQLQYAGTFDSEGEFSPGSAVDSVFRMRSILEEGEIRDHRGGRSLRLDGPVKGCLAHSFGTWVLSRAFAEGFRPDLIGLFSPFLGVGRELPVAGARVSMSRQVDHLQGALPLTFRLSSTVEWAEFFGSGDFPYPDHASGVGTSALLAVTGEDDPSLDAISVRRRFEWFASRYAPATNSIRFEVVPGGTHDEGTLLSDVVVSFMRKHLGADIQE